MMHVKRFSFTFDSPQLLFKLSSHSLTSTLISAMCPFAKLLATHLSSSQKNNHALEVDLHLRLKGISDGSVYSLGDCATIENPRLLDHIMDIFQNADHDSSGALSWQEFLDAAKMMIHKYPLSEGHLKKLNDLFVKYDEDHSGTIDLSELRKMLGDIDKKMTSLPAVSPLFFLPPYSAFS